jgi:predicted ATPase
MSYGSKPQYLVSLQLVRAANDAYPFNLPAIRTLDLQFIRPVTFFVGENGTGKSTVIEALAELCGFPASGGGRNELAAKHGPEGEAA